MPPLAPHKKGPTDESDSADNATCGGGRGNPDHATTAAVARRRSWLHGLVVGVLSSSCTPGVFPCASSAPCVIRDRSCPRDGARRSRGSCRRRDARFHFPRHSAHPVEAAIVGAHGGTRVRQLVKCVERLALIATETHGEGFARRWRRRRIR